MNARNIIGLYAASINLGSFGLFFYDKQQALNKGWRIPEKTLQATALMGGWIGGIAAINTFRHKTKKEPFRTIYGGCVLANIGIVSAAVVRRRDFMGVISRMVNNGKSATIVAPPVYKKKKMRARS